MLYLMKCVICCEIVTVLSCLDSNVGEKPGSCVAVSSTPLAFPVSRSVLWDHRDIGPPTFVSIAHCRLIHVVLDLLV